MKEIAKNWKKITEIYLNYSNFLLKMDALGIDSEEEKQRKKYADRKARLESLYQIGDNINLYVGYDIVYTSDRKYAIAEIGDDVLNSSYNALSQIPITIHHDAKGKIINIFEGSFRKELVDPSLTDPLNDKQWNKLKNRDKIINEVEFGKIATIDFVICKMNVPLMSSFLSKPE
jgi:hypothetical protein